MDRRTFLGWVGIGLLSSSLPVAIAACSQQETPPSNPPNSSASSPISTPDSEGFIQVGTLEQLQKEGEILLKNSPIGPVLVVQQPKIIAVNPICTHKGCLLKWKAQEQSLECPCHDAQFKLDGSVTKGPAKQPLKLYTTKLEGNTILVKTIG